MHKSNVPELVVHELGHLAEDLRTRKERLDPAATAQEAESYVSYVEQQDGVEPLEKGAVAGWAVDDAPIPLSLCAGLFFDAGSGCKAVWDMILDRI